MAIHHEGLGHGTSPGGPETLDDLLTSAATAAPDRLAAVDSTEPATTFADLHRQVRSLSAWIAERTQPGDRIAVVADNSTNYLRLYYAVPATGRVLVPINQRFRPSEQTALLVSATPTLLVGDPQFLDALAPLAESVPPIDEIVSFESEKWVQALLTDPIAPTSLAPARSPDDEAWLLFTSGSTGVPKGAVHTHRSLLAAVEATVVGRSTESGGVYLLPFPMCHIAGYNALVHHATASTVVLVSQFRPAEFVEVVNRHGVTSCSLAPTMLHALLAYLEESGTAMPGLRSMAYGSAAISTDLMDRAGKHLDLDFHHGYGMTETGGNLSFLGPADHRAGLAGDASILRTAGHPHVGIEVRIVDDAGGDIPTGESGEIVVRGPQVLVRYWQADADADAWFPERWFRTGDIGRLDTDGRLAIVDRRKDIVITGGENVSSREVEDVLSTHPAVDAVAVVGVPDEYWGEAICAVVVCRDGACPAPDDLVEHARAHLSSFKRPRHILFVDELPLTTNGKIDKVAVRQFAHNAH